MSDDHTVSCHGPFRYDELWARGPRTVQLRLSDDGHTCRRKGTVLFGCSLPGDGDRVDGAVKYNGRLSVLSNSSPPPKHVPIPNLRT
jgi:hypothetical protein